MPQRSLSLKRLVPFVLAAYILTWAVVEFENIAWGTGVWLGQFALTWALALFLFGLFCILCLVVLGISLWSPLRLERVSRFLPELRRRLGVARWILAILFLFLPVYVLQYTFWGKVLHEPYLRILLAGLSCLLLGWVITKDKGLISWQSGLTALVLVTGTYTLFASLIEVTSYPFSLGWSEGNRLWDYSVLFARHLYNYPTDQPIPVLLDIGRQFIGGIPFLIPGLTIWQARLWVALVEVIPYLLLGWAAFRLTKNQMGRWLLAGIWAFTFVRQGPIHPPLLICAIVVALVWERPLWLAIPLIAVTSFFAEISRFTWLFAPAMWAAMLEFSSALAPNRQLDKRTWVRALSVGAAGAFGGYATPFWIPSVIQWARSLGESPTVAAGDVPVPVETVVGSGVTVSAVGTEVSAQPLLWYRLFPNATYGQGILIGLALAALPLIAILVYLAITGRWKLNLWQKLAIVLPLLAFLGVGLIVSVKIGGGGDLHNMDMFIIGLMFAAAIAWRNGAYKWMDELHSAPAWVQLVMVALILIPAYQPLKGMMPLRITEDRKLVATLADIVEDPLPNPLPDTLPTKSDTDDALGRMQRVVANAAQRGEVLFMDQRQLLTFGYIQNVPLIPEYDKKVLINEAMSGNTAYFANFYRDLAAQRFTLIITNHVNRRLDKSEGNFGEENNAWVKWVTTPLLCYYESFDRLKRVDVELLVPRQDISGCEKVLPIQANE